jgi:hypothetical protein
MILVSPAVKSAVEARENAAELADGCRAEADAVSVSVAAS